MHLSLLFKGLEHPGKHFRNSFVHVKTERSFPGQDCERVNVRSCWSYKAHRHRMAEDRFFQQIHKFASCMLATALCGAACDVDVRLWTKMAWYASPRRKRSLVTTASFVSRPVSHSPTTQSHPPGDHCSQLMEDSAPAVAARHAHTAMLSESPNRR